MIRARKKGVLYPQPNEERRGLRDDLNLGRGLRKRGLASPPPSPLGEKKRPKAFGLPQKGREGSEKGGRAWQECSGENSGVIRFEQRREDRDIKNI